MKGEQTVEKQKGENWIHGGALFWQQRRKTNNVQEQGKAEVRTALIKMKKNKAAGIDKIVIDWQLWMIWGLIRLPNDKQNAGGSQLMKLILTKTMGELMSYITKLMIRAHSRIRSGIVERQYGCARHLNKKGNLHDQNAIGEIIEMQKELCLCFID